LRKLFLLPIIKSCWDALIKQWWTNFFTSDINQKKEFTSDCFLHQCMRLIC